MPFLEEMDSVTGLVCSDLRSKGLELTEAYRNAQPFPHIIIDDFLPTEILDRCLEKFPSNLGPDDVQFNRDQERGKAQFNPDSLDAWQRALFYSFNSKPFIRMLENISGIKGLIPDPYFLGAGFHEIGQGGHLAVHVDFNHHKPMNLERRINLLIYLNKHWKEEYGGQLELWNADMTRCAQSVAPIFNRAAMFSTSDISYHGNPQPVQHPDGTPRRSIALYYYTSTWSDVKRDFTTQFKIRPGSGDRVDRAVRHREFVQDLLPPIVLRGAKRLKERLAR